jgi:DNA-binding NarL/FixJ family response regulator
MPTPPPLSDRHRDLLRQEAQGRTLGEAAHELGITRATARSHWREIFRRFEPALQQLRRSRSRINVVLVALGIGVLTMADIATPDPPDPKDATENARPPD